MIPELVAIGVLMKAEGIDTVENEIFFLTNRSCGYSSTVILPGW